MSPLELALAAQKAKPHIRYAYDNKAEVVGAFDEKLGRFVTVAVNCIGNLGWAHVPFEVLVNGVAMPREWIEV